MTVLSKEIARMGFRNAFRRKRIAAFTIVSIAISVSLLYTAFSASTNLQQSANLFLQDSLSPLDISVYSTKWGNPLTVEKQESILSLLGVNNTIPRIEERGYVRNDSERLYVILVGLDPSQEAHVGRFEVLNGSFDLSEQGCFMTEQARDLLNSSLGSELEVILSSGASFFNITGFGITVDKGLSGPIIIVSLERAWDIFNIKYPDQSVNKFLIEVYDIFEIPAVISQIEGLYGDDVRLDNLKAYQLQLADLFLSQARVVLLAIVLIACVIASFRVFSSFAVVFSERKYETGVVMAFGANRSSVLSLLISEIGTIGLIGAIFGAIVGIGIGYVVINFVVLISQIMTVAPTTQLYHTTVILDIPSMVVAMSSGIGLTLVSGYFPAWRASRQSVVESLAKGSLPITSSRSSLSEETRRKAQFVMGLIGVVLTSLVFIQIISDIFELYIIQEDNLRILSIPAFMILIIAISPKLQNSRMILKPLNYRASKIVRSLTSKNLRRNTLSIFVVFNLFTAITILYFASTNVGYVITESWKRNIGGQTSPANVVAYFDEPAEFAILDEVRMMRNITEVAPTNQVLGYLEHRTSFELGLVLGVETQGFERMASLSIVQSFNQSMGLDIINQARTCVVSDYTARALNAELGSTILIDSRVNLTIVAICSSSIPAFAISVIEPIFIIVNTQTWSILMEEEFTIASLLIDSSDPETTIQDLETIQGLIPLLVSEIEADYKAALQTVQIITDTSLMALFTATMFSAFLSGWAIASTRRREIGMLAALGMKQNEIARTLTTESAVAMASGVIVGSIFGIIVEIALSDIIIRFGGQVYALVDIRTALLVFLSLIVSVVFAYYAISKTTKTEVVRLLRDQERSN